MMPRWQQAILVGFLLVGGVQLVVGVKTLVDSQRFLAKAAGGNATVVDVVEVAKQGQGGSGSTTGERFFYPVLQFVTASGQVVRFQADEGRDPPAYRVGDLVRVLYDPADPQRARRDTSVSRWGDGAASIFLGLGFVVVGAVLLRRGKPVFRRPGELGG